MAVGFVAANEEHDAPLPRPFVRPSFTLQDPTASQHSRLATLVDLVAFNAAHNPRHTFCIQYMHDVRVAPRKVTFENLHHAVLRCTVWLAQQGLSQPPTLTESGKIVKTSPVALLMASDIAWFIYFLALIRLGVPVLSISARLSARSVVHLLSKTNTQALITSPQVQGLIDDLFPPLPDGEPTGIYPAVYRALSYSQLIDGHQALPISQAPNIPYFLSADDRNVVILHSSGTTGLPKPIFHSHAYLLGYAACHRLSSADVQGSVNFSTLPLYHGFGLLAPCLALSIGMPCVLPAATTIPTGPSVLDILHSSHATSLMTVPSILEELFLVKHRQGIESLTPLRFVAVGGAPMKHSVAKPLASVGVPLVNHWGVTEIGAIAPVFIPSPDYDWRYLRLRDDLDLRLEAADAAGHYRLVGRAPGAREDFIVQDLLLANPAHPTTEVRIAGRSDDLVILATGQKIRPAPLEAAVSEHPLVRAALAFGDGRLQMGLIVEAAPHVDIDPTDPRDVENYLERIWPAVEHANRGADAHAEVARDMLVVTSASTRPLLRTPKGSVPRAPNVQRFKDDIDTKYGPSPYCTMDVVGAPVSAIGAAQLADVVRTELGATAGRLACAMGDGDDFFERGMNSLQASVLRRRLSRALCALLSVRAVALPACLVYEYPTVLQLATALSRICAGTPAPKASSTDRAALMRCVVQEYVGKLESQIPQTSGETSSTGHGRGVRILLTGSTGSLGGSLLGELASQPAVERIYALGRRKHRTLRLRQEETLHRLGIELGAGWNKVVLLEADLDKDRFGLDTTYYDELRTVTHIIHNAWPMDFNRKLSSFRPHIEAACNIIKLAADSRSPHRVRVFFSSSIAVVGRHPLVTDNAGGAIKELPLPNPDVVEHMGYAEAKWVCERLFDHANALFPAKVAATSVRIGQLTGCESTGAWSPLEHLPMLLKSCQAVGKLPALPGYASWTPVNRAAAALAEIALMTKEHALPVMHLENASRRPWFEIMEAMGKLLHVPCGRHVGFSEWLALVKQLPDPLSNPTLKLIPFLETSFPRLALGDVVLDTTLSRGLSSTLRGCGSVSDAILARYVQYWRAEGFIM